MVADDGVSSGEIPVPPSEVEVGVSAPPPVEGGVRNCVVSASGDCAGVAG